MNGFMNLDAYVHKFCEFLFSPIAEQQSKPKRGKDLLVVAVSVSGNVGSTRNDCVLEAIFNVLGVCPASALLTTQLIVLIALCLNVANVVGYWKCSKEAKQKFASVAGAVSQSILKQAVTSMASTAFGMATAPTTTV